MNSYITLIKPRNNKNISLYKKNVSRYIKKQNRAFKNANQDRLDVFLIGEDIYPYVTNKSKDNSSKAITFKFDTNVPYCDLNLIIIDELNNSFTYALTSNSIKVGNLIPNRKYSWHIESKDIKSEIFTFYLKDTYCLAYTDHVWNVRDCGGKVTVDNRFMKYGLLFRGPELTRFTYYTNIDDKDFNNRHSQIVTKKDEFHLHNLGFKVELDLRFDAETNMKKECSISKKDHPIDYVQIVIGSYRTFLENGYKEENKVLYRQIFDLLANADQKPVYIHCFGGADRTGTVCFLLEALLGVKLEDLIIDYELTAIAGNLTRVKPFNKEIDTSFRENNNFYYMANWLITFANENETLKETVERYLVDIIGVKQEVINKIRNIFLTEVK